VVAFWDRDKAATEKRETEDRSTPYNLHLREQIALAGLPLPKVIVSSDEIRNGKPDPEGFLRAAERLGTISARSCGFRVRKEEL